MITKNKTALKKDALKKLSDIVDLCLGITEALHLLDESLGEKLKNGFNPFKGAIKEALERIDREDSIGFEDDPGVFFHGYLRTGEGVEALSMFVNPSSSKSAIVSSMEKVFLAGASARQSKMTKDTAAAVNKEREEAAVS